MPIKRFVQKEIEKMNKEATTKFGIGMSKSELIKKSGIDKLGSIDYALPLQWVNYMKEKYDLDYDNFVGNTVMLYNEDNTYGLPISYCQEMQIILDKERV